MGRANDWCYLWWPNGISFPGNHDPGLSKNSLASTYIKWNYEHNGGLYDDIYMDLTFVDILEKYGLDAPIDSFANAYAQAPYPLWHANQAGRYNILHGIKAPQSGHWLNNPHADCIDFQIESDFAGLMSPGMPAAASAISNKIGHIMNYGDGWYGGVYISNMYSLAFVLDDIHFVVKEALKAIPTQSQFYQCINDVIQWQQQYPNDWKATWFEVQKKWASDIGCPDGVYSPFNIDAKVNAAYVVIGLLYGNGDFNKTMDIATRCGQDADCNPSSAAGVLGTLLGYNKIPNEWKDNLKEAEDMPVKYTTMSLNQVYAISNKHALENIKRNSGTVNDSMITIPYQAPVAVAMEESFAGLYPKEKININKKLTDTFSLQFEGNGFVITGSNRDHWEKVTPFSFKVQQTVDGVTDTLDLPFNYLTRKTEISWKYTLPNGKHTVSLKLLNPDKISDVMIADVLIYEPNKK